LHTRGCRFESDLVHAKLFGNEHDKRKIMTDKEPTREELDELTRARNPSTAKELAKKAEKYILEQAEKANGKPLKEDK
jgi:hypothetical protein